MQGQWPYQGRNAIAVLAEEYPQLYLVPGPQGAAQYRLVVGRGQQPESKDLSHFRGTERDQLRLEDTPAGPVRAVTLCDRADFELFLQIMSRRCEPVEIPPTQGAAILDGVINWNRIRSHQKEYEENARAAGNPAPDWGAEFKRFTADRRNYTDALIILSEGPYSAVPAERAGYPEKEWRQMSLTIRRCHECTHFICRRLFPELIDPVWDELTADAVGIFAALGRYDVHLAELFLGIDEHGYTGGRLENYAGDETLDGLAVRAHRAVLRLQEMIAASGIRAPYDLAVYLEENKFHCVTVSSP